MQYEIDKKVYNFILSQPKQVKELFLEILDQIPILLEKIDNNLQANAFEFAVEAKDIITQYVIAIKAYVGQHDKASGYGSGVWSDEQVGMVIDEANRLYSLANDLIVNKFRILSGDSAHVHI